MDYKLPKLPYRDENSNKGSFGKILNISGSKYMTGAACLSSLAALKIGAGYVEIASCDEVLKAVACYSPEIVLAPTEKIPGLINQATVLLIGCGLSTTDSAKEIFTKVIGEKQIQKQSKKIQNGKTVRQVPTNLPVTRQTEVA